MNFKILFANNINIILGDIRKPLSPSERSLCSMFNKDESVLRNVKCDVSQCLYNDLESHCTADNISVGPHSASCCDDTACETFEEA